MRCMVLARRREWLDWVLLVREPISIDQATAKHHKGLSRRRLNLVTRGLDRDLSWATSRTGEIPKNFPVAVSRVLRHPLRKYTRHIRAQETFRRTSEKRHWTP